MSKGYTRKAVKEYFFDSSSSQASSIDDSGMYLLNCFLNTRSRPCPDYFKFCENSHRLFNYQDSEEMQNDLEILIEINYPKLQSI